MEQKGCNMNKTQMFVALCAAVLAQMAWAVDFPAAVDGVITLTTAGTYSAAVPTSTKLVVNANGSVTLSSTTKYTGTVEIESGSTLVVPNTTVLASAPINVKRGGTLNPTFASPGQWNKVFLQPITIAGTGNGGIGAFKYGGSGNGDSIVKTLVLSADATIDCSARWGISNGNGAGTLDLAGHTLTRVGNNNLMLVSLTVTPGTFVNNAGTVTFQNNGGEFYVKDGCKAEDTVFRFEGGTLTFWNTAAYVPYKVILNGGKLTAGSGNNVPPKNCISGPVEVNFWMKIVTDWMKNSSGGATTLGLMGPLSIASDKAIQLDCERTLYVGGPLSGSGQLKASSNGFISIQADDLGKAQPVMQGGTIECDVGKGLIGMLRCANGGGVYGVFHHKRGDLSFSSGDNPRVGESANSFGAYVFESGKMCPSNTFYLAAEKADSHGLFLQKGGHFDLKANPQTDADAGKQFRAGACNAEIAFIQTGGTNDTAYGRVAGDSKYRFDLSSKGSTNMLFAITGSNTLFRTDGFNFACGTNRTQGVIAINDGAVFKARRFTCPITRKEGTDVTLCLNGGVIHPLFYGGWANSNGGSTDFLKRAPENVVVFGKGVVIDTSECLSNVGAPGSSQIPLTLKAPEGQGIASIAIPTDAANAAYHGPVPVEIRGPAGSYGAAAYADFDFSTKKLSKIVVVSPGCNYDATTKIYVRSPDCKSRYACTTFTLTGTQTSGGLVKRGANAAQLYGACTYQGGTVVEGGTLSMYNSGFPNNTALTVRKGAIFDGGTNSRITVSRLEGEGSVTTPSGLTVTEALVLDADRVFADGATALTSSGKVTFSDGATVNVSLTDAQKAAYAERKLVTVLSSSNGISGMPRLLVNGQSDGNWTLVNTGTALKFGPRRGVVVIFK